MDIKDSYLHGTVGVVKSISVDADILSYRLADVAGTTITVTMPTATQEANGLLSSDDKKKLDNMIATQVANDLILKINSGTIEDTSLYTYNGSADKTLDIKEGSNVILTAEANSLTIAASDTKVTQTNTTNSDSYRVLFSESANNTTETATVRKSSKLLFNPNTGTLQTTLLKGNVWGTLYTEKYVSPSAAGNIDSGTLGWFTASSSSGYAGDSTGFPVNNNANGILWLGTHRHGSDSTKIGYGHLLGFSSNGNIYHRPISNGSFPTTDNGSSWKQLAFTDSNITGNAASADKLKTARKLWGLDFDGTADVKGSLTEVTSINMNGDIVINDGTNHDRYIKWLYNNTDSYGWRIGYLGSKGGDDNDLTFDSHRKSEGWASALYFKHTTLDAHFAGIVNAPTFQGNLDGTYINKLTDYSKASSGSNVAATDTLNIALGKIEYKAHFAYEWITSVTASDTDQYVNKWGEIVVFLDSVKEGTDILDEFVTRKTDLTITGAKTFTSSITLSLDSLGFYLYKGCGLEKWSGYGPTLVSEGSDLNFYIRKNTDRADYAKILHTKNTYINNGVITINGVSITPLTLHLSLANYLPLSGGTLTSANYNILNIKRDTAANVGVAINFLNNNGDICDIMADPVTHSFKRGYNLQTYTIWDEGNDGPLMRFKGSVSTDYVDLTNTSAGDANYTNLNPGIYGISRSGYSELLVSFASNVGSTSSLELKTSYEHNSKLYIRKTIDANRICGAWRALAFHDDISESINKYYWANLKLSETQDTNTSPIFGLTTAKYYVATLQMTLHTNGLSSDLTVANRGGLFSNGIIFTNSGVWSDVGFIRLLSNAENNTVLEIGTGDDGASTDSEAIAARLYRAGAIAKEAWLLDTAGNTSFPGIVTSAGFVRAGSADTHVLLGGGGHKAISDFMLKTDMLTSNLTTISKTITVGSDWVDTGIVLNASTFTEGSGSYIVQVSRGSTYVWTGVMTVILSGSVSKSASGEIILHGGGFDMDDSSHTFLRTYGDITNKVYKLQIARNGTPRELTFTFKFKRLI